MADNYFCLDIGERFTKVADIKKTNDTLEIASLGKIETNVNFYSTDIEKDLNIQSQNIKKLVDSLKITKKNINVVIPGSFTYNQILVMPALNEKELISAIKYQADQFIPMPIEETNIDIEIIDEYKTEEKLLILIVAAPKRLIEKIQTTVELSGLVPESIENELSASSRFVSVFSKKLLSQSKNGLILANFGLNSTSLAYFQDENLTLKESHNFAIGYSLFLKEIQVNTDSDNKKAGEILLSYDKKAASSYPVDVIAGPLIREFTQELKRFALGKNVSKIVVFNEIFLFPALPSFVFDDLKIETKEIDLYSSCQKSPLVDSYKKELSVYLPTFGGNLR